MKTPQRCVPAKLAAPRARQHVVKRQCVVDDLARVPSRTVAVMNAPPGYGKTTVPAQLYEALAGGARLRRFDQRSTDAALPARGWA